jgi:hypothetical protein
MIDVVEVKYQVVEVERQKCVCRCGGAIETARGPARAVDGGYSLRFAIKVAFDKYVAHLPRTSRYLLYFAATMFAWIASSVASGG